MLIQKGAALDPKNKVQQPIEDQQKKDTNTSNGFTSNGSTPGNPSTPVKSTISYSGNGTITHPAGVTFTGTFESNFPQSGTVTVPAGVTLSVVDGNVDWSSVF